MTRGGVSEETRTYCRERDRPHIWGTNSRVRVTGHLQHNSSCPTQKAPQHHSTAEPWCCWSGSLSTTLFPFAFLGKNIPQTNLRAMTGSSHSLNHESCGFRKGLRLRGGVSTLPLLEPCCLWGNSTLSHCPLIQEGNIPPWQDPNTGSPQMRQTHPQITFPVFCPSPVKRISPKASVGISWMCLLGSHSLPRKMGGLAASSRCCSLR